MQTRPINGANPLSRQSKKRVRPSPETKGGVRRYLSAREFLSIANAPVLNWENADDFARLHGALEDEVNPRGFVEEMYISEIAAIVWELLRWRRLKQIKINRAYWDKLHDMLHQACIEPVESTEHDNNKSKTIRFNQGKFDHVWDLAKDWFDDEKSRKQISELLGGLEIDDLEIETSVLDNLSEEIAAIDRKITAAESRRDKTLRCIAEYRQSLAVVIKRTTDAIIEGEVVDRPAIEQRTTEKSAG